MRCIFGGGTTLVLMLLVFGGAVLMAQTVKRENTVVIGGYERVVASWDGEVVVKWRSDEGLIRHHRRDSVDIVTSLLDNNFGQPGSMTFVGHTLFVIATKINSGKVMILKADEDATTTTVFADTLISSDSGLGGPKRELYGLASAPKSPLLIVYGVYRIPTPGGLDVRGRLLFIDTRTMTVVQRIDSANPDIRWSPNAERIICSRKLPYAEGAQMLQVDATSGRVLDAMECRSTSLGTNPIGRGSVMFKDSLIGDARSSSWVRMFEDPRRAHGCLAGPNIIMTTRQEPHRVLCEGYDLLTRRWFLIDTINADYVKSVQVNAVDGIATVFTIYPSAAWTYSIRGIQGKSGVRCFRDVDTLLVFDHASYLALQLSDSSMGTVKLRVDGRRYDHESIEPARIRVEHVGYTPFSATVYSSTNVVVSTDTSKPLRAGLPGGFTSASFTAQGLKNLTIDSACTRIVCVAPTMKAGMMIDDTGPPTLDASTLEEVPGYPDDVAAAEFLDRQRYVTIVDRISTEFGFEDRVIEQSAVLSTGEIVALAQISIPMQSTDLLYQTVVNKERGVCGLLVSYKTSRFDGECRFYTVRKSGGSFVPLMKMNRSYYEGFVAINGETPGRFLLVNGTSYVVDAVTMDTLDSISSVGKEASLVTDSLLISQNVIKRRNGGVWETQTTFSDDQVARLVRISPTHSAFLTYRNGDIGYIVEHSTGNIVERFGVGFGMPTCGVYSARHHGLFIGFFSGVAAFLPIATRVDATTSVPNEDHQVVASSPFVLSGQNAVLKTPVLGLHTCDVYSIRGEHIASISLDGSMCDVELPATLMPAGVYVAVFIGTKMDPVVRTLLME